MLSVAQNERLVRVGPGTPAGTLFRRYWQPAVLSSEVPEKDGPPVRVRRLGEDLLAFRDSNGDVGLVDAYCPHRMAPFYFGRNEECGIRCAYHGWKFDRHGDCVDMPTEPGNEIMREKTKLLAYPTVEKGGVVWAYMGPADKKPPAPDYEWMRVPSTHLHVSKTYEECNYLQALEGGLDTAHSSYAHNNNMASKSDPRLMDKSPKLDVNPTSYGYNYVSTRQMGQGSSRCAGAFTNSAVRGARCPRSTDISGRRSTTRRPTFTTGIIATTTNIRCRRSIAIRSRRSTAAGPPT
jgi:phthalate 4,5-dioxygenase oxygenase subunit